MRRTVELGVVLVFALASATLDQDTVTAAGVHGIALRTSARPSSRVVARIPTYYEVLNVTPPLFLEGQATGTNPNGQVAITADNDGNNGYPILYSGGSWIDIGPALSCPDPDFPDQEFCPFSTADGVNVKGEVVGMAGNFHTSHAYRYSAATGKAVLLPTLGGDQGRGLGINGSGEVVGWSVTARGRQRAFLWDGSTTRGLGTLGGPSSIAKATYAQGQAVGCADTAAGPEHAFLYANGVMLDLGVPDGYRNSCASTINASGLVGGSSVRRAPAGFGCAGWLRSAAGFTLLPLPTGADCIEVLDLNNAGEAVGSYSGVDLTRTFGFVYREGALRTLDQRIPFDRRFHITDATGNNFIGQVVGTAFIGSRDLTEAVILTPIQVFDETRRQLRYAGSWTTGPSPSAFGGSVTSSDMAGSSLSFTFTGRRLSVIGPVGPDLGDADVFLDGAPDGRISEFNIEPRSRRRVFTWRLPSVGIHTVEIVVQGNAPLQIDAITVTPR